MDDKKTNSELFPTRPITSTNILWIASIAIVYFVLSRLSFSLSIGSSKIAAIWPLSGVFLAAFLLTRPSLRPYLALSLFLVDFASELLTGSPFLLCLIYSLILTSDAILGTWLWLHFIGKTTKLNKVHDLIFWIIISVLFTNVLFSFCQAAAAAHFIPETSYWGAWLNFTVADGIGNLLLTPLILSWADWYRRKPKPFWSKRILEGILLVAAVAVLTYTALRLLPGHFQFSILLLYLNFPLLIWAAFRFGIRGTSSALVLISAMTVFHVNKSWISSNLTQISDVNFIITMQLYLAALIFPALFLAILITEAKSVRENLAASEEHFRILSENSQDVIWIFDTEQMRFTFVSPSIYLLRGFTPEEIMEGNLSLAVNSAILDKTTLLIKSRAEALRSGKIPANNLFEDEIEQFCKNGSTVWTVVTTNFSVNPADGHVIVRGITRNIDVRKRVEKTLQENESRLVAAQAVAHVGNWELDLSKRTMWASAEAFRIYGLESTSPFIPLEQAQRIPVLADRARLDQELKSLISGQKPYEIEFSIHRASDGSLRIIHSLATLEKDEKGQPIRVCGVIEDVTERKRAEKELAESEERYRTLFENNHLVMLVVDPDNSKIQDANPAASDFYGWTKKELLKMKISQINTLSEQEVFNEMQEAREQKRNYFIFKHRKKNGQIVDVEVFSHPVQIKGETYLFSLVNDISERKQAENKISEQLEELRRWYNTTLGREKRILELKKEVNDLLLQSGHSAKYASTQEDDTNG